MNTTLIINYNFYYIKKRIIC